MIRIILIATILAALPAHAGFKMYGPGGQYMNSTETEEERANRAARDEYHRKVTAEAQAATARHAASKPKKEQTYTREELLQGKPYDGPVEVDRGPAPGGHRRHIWREKTGFNTPAHKIRYENEIRRLRRELKKERAKPNPAGSPPPKL